MKYAWSLLAKESAAVDLRSPPSLTKPIDAIFSFEKTTERILNEPQTNLPVNKQIINYNVQVTVKLEPFDIY